MTTLAEIRAKLKEQDEKMNSSFSGDNSVYAHWNIEEGGDPAQLRFLPDADETNTFFWVERLQINLGFAGIKGQPNSKAVRVKVPCIEMWEPVGSCPILAEIRPWFKMNDPSLEELARKYWKKKSYLMQGFVHKDPNSKDEPPENPIRRFIFTPQIFDIIKASLMDPELEELPTDYKLGLDFFVHKTPSGKYSSYTTSKWSRRETALSADELAAIDKYGLFDLKSFLPKKPDAKHLEIIKEMFDASVDGEAYDPDRWGEYYKAPGMTSPITPTAENSEKKEDAKPTPKAKSEDEPEVNGNKSDPESSSDKAQAILDMIQKRK